jgi:hypothetical protein
MIIYHTTYHLTNEAYPKGLDFFKSELIPAAMRSGKLYNPRIMRVLNEDADVNGVSLSIQFSVENMSALDEWMAEEGKTLYKTMTEMFSDEIVSFSTLLEEIQLVES